MLTHSDTYHTMDSTISSTYLLLFLKTVLFPSNHNFQREAYNFNFQRIFPRTNLQLQPSRHWHTAYCISNILRRTNLNFTVFSSPKHIGHPLTTIWFLLLNSLIIRILCHLATQQKTNTLGKTESSQKLFQPSPILGYKKNKTPSPLLEISFKTLKNDFMEIFL